MSAPSSSGQGALSAEALLRLILDSRVYDVVTETPLELARRLSLRLGNQVLLKREDLGLTFSFKLRGAYNKMAHLTAAEGARGVIASSAGNHAQGVAYAARALGMSALIVMPETTPLIKVEAVAALGAEVVLFGDTYGEAKRRSDELTAASGRVFIAPFDDELVIAGAGTIGQEILRHGAGSGSAGSSGRGLDAIFVPVGGGGLIAGIAAYVAMVRPEIKVIGVEPYEADSMFASVAAGHRVVLPRVGIFADGVAVAEVGALTFPIVQAHVAEIVRVSNDEICAAIKDIFDDTRTVVEPAGALALAGLRAWVERRGEAGRPARADDSVEFGAWSDEGGAEQPRRAEAREEREMPRTGLRLVAVLSGANMNFDRLGFVAERAELGESREALLAVTIPERPGAFREFCAALGRRVVTEFNYRLSSRAAAHIFVGIAVRTRDDIDDLVGTLAGAGYGVADLGDNELAKLHVRHMVGGRSAEVHGERLFRFEFPERPGALMEFLDALGGRWNISLFHYRNHGSDFGRVAVGFEVPAGETEALESFLERLGYPYQPEEHNAAYELFLA